MTGADALEDSEDSLTDAVAAVVAAAAAVGVVVVVEVMSGYCGRRTGGRRLEMAATVHDGSDGRDGRGGGRLPQIRVGLRSGCDCFALRVTGRLLELKSLLEQEFTQTQHQIFRRDPGHWELISRHHTQPAGTILFKIFLSIAVGIFRNFKCSRR